MNFFALTLFPELFSNWSSLGLVGQGFAKKFSSLEFINPRRFASGVHQSVDDKVYGGGDGMVQAFEPWSKSILSAREKAPKAQVIFLSPQGQLWTQKLARELLQRENRSFIFVCGRYGGFDQRLIQKYADLEISIGDYVLNGGELPAMVVMETLMRGVPSVLGHVDSFNEDSFGEDGLLECPVFTRPQHLPGENLAVPEFLLSGNHSEIARMQKAIALVRTLKRRPELVRHWSGLELKKAKDLVAALPESDRKLLGV